MTVPKQLGGLVATEGNQLEEALKAAGFDPGGTLSWPIWDVFTASGLRAALAALEVNSEAPPPLPERSKPLC